MSVKYSLALRRNPLRGDEPKKFYAQSQGAGDWDFETICETIADRGTCIKGDVMAAIDGLIYTMKQGLQNGAVIRLGEFGSFQMGLKSKGTLTEKEFTRANIVNTRIIFRPGKLLTAMMKNLEFTQVPKLAAVKKTDDKTDNKE